ncbi:unnamed protein product [Closterium sp. Yama58-4]|nr:unnamed protein product [Closterium sp. Yama58-4]
MAGLDAEMSGEISGKQLSRKLKARRIRTQILELNVTGGPVADSKRILSAASDFFRANFGADRRTDFSDWSPIPERYLGSVEAGGLEADWTEEEVKAAFKDMAKNKSQGLDRLPKELFENNWDLLGGSFMSLVKDFTATAKLPAETKGAVTILLHKKGDKNQLGNYHPITLLNFTYKILAKVLADRLKKVLHNVISPEQYGFIPGRKLTDAVALVADIIDAAKNGNKDWHLLLVDFQKAFDSVSRSFIFQVLRKMSLPDRFVGWIEGLHAQTTTRMLINGWLGGGIDVESGVRQGCPLAPYLFLCAVEPLVQEVERKQLGLCDTASGKRLSYLGYADDTTLILEGKQQIKEAEEVLEEFERKSGLATNKEKSVVLPLGANLGMPSEGSFKWDGPKDAERLLGMWVTPDGSCLPTWEKTLGGVTRKLTGWWQKYLTEKARTAVSNCYISPMIAFQAQVYPPPEEIWAETERLLHNFVSGNKATPAKDFVLWSKELLYTPRKGGGLGVQDPNVLLACLSARRVGLLMTETDELKRELMLKAADLPLGLDTFTSHDKLLKNWEGRSQRWKQTCEAFMKSPLSERTVPLTREAVGQERLVFNRKILVGVVAPVGGQKHAKALWETRLGDLVKQLPDGSWAKKSMEELTEELGDKGPARLALKALEMAPTEWKETLLTPGECSAGSVPTAAQKLPQVPLFEDGKVIPLAKMKSFWKGEKLQSHRRLKWAEPHSVRSGGPVVPEGGIQLSLPGSDIDCHLVTSALVGAM